MSPWAWLGIVLTILASYAGTGTIGYRLGYADVLERAIRAETQLVTIDRESKTAVKAATEEKSRIEKWSASVIDTIRADAAFDADLAARRGRATVRRLLDSAACLGEPSGAPAEPGAATAAPRTDAATPAAGVVHRSRADDLSALVERAERLTKQVTGLQAVTNHYLETCNGPV